MDGDDNRLARQIEVAYNERRSRVFAAAETMKRRMLSLAFAKDRTACRTPTFRTNIVMGLLLLALFGLACTIIDLTSTRVLIGADEKFEVTKGLLWSRGYPLYSRVWDDQPPLHTALLRGTFQLFGATIGAARCVALGFGLSLLTVTFLLVRRYFDSLAGFLAALALISGPKLWELFVSDMLEVPAIGTGLWALWPILRWRRNHQPLWLCASGLAFALALQIKLTAAILCPGLVAEIVLGSLAKGRRSTEIDLASSAESGNTCKLRVLQDLVIWTGTAITAFCLVGLSLGSGYQQAWQSHFSFASRRGAVAHVTALTLPVFFQDPVVVYGAVAGLILALVRSQWRVVAFPVAVLTTAIAVHMVHRPFWSYYYLHFAVPLAWLLGYGAAGLARFPGDAGKANVFGRPLVRLASHLVIAVLICGFVVYEGNRLASDFEEIRGLPRIRDSVVISKMKDYAQWTKWVYTDGSIYPFHAGLLVIPELAVLPKKRFWSGQIDDGQIAAIVRRYRPEQIVLNSFLPSPDMKPFVDSNYVVAARDDTCCLYIEKSIFKGLRQ